MYIFTDVSCIILVSEYFIVSLQNFSKLLIKTIANPLGKSPLPQSYLSWKYIVAGGGIFWYI